MPLYNWLCNQGNDIILYSDEINIRQLERINPRLIISYSYKYIIKPDLISFMQGRIVNLHISYLPWNRGADPNFWSFIHNTPKGVTIHEVDAGLDTGSIICQKELDFDEEIETFRSAYKKLHQEIQFLMMNQWQSILNGTYTSFLPDYKGSYHRHIEFVEFTQRHPLKWDDCISTYKRRLSTEG